MKTYYVSIDFRRGPSIGISVIAAHEEDAKKLALREAQGFGFDGEPTKYKVEEV